MFPTRLNPTKPTAAHRAVLERVGAACRELRPIEDAAYLARRVNGSLAALLGKHAVLGWGIAPEHGGLGSDAMLYAMAFERIGREGVGPAMALAYHVLGACVVASAGSLAQQALYLPAAARGECLFGVALADPEPREAHAGETSFEATAAGFVLEGQKSWVTNAELAHVLVVLARDRSAEALSAFLVETAVQGCVRTAIAPKIGLPTVSHGEVRFERCRVPCESLVGVRGAGLDVAGPPRMSARLAAAAASVGVLADCLEEAAAHRIGLAPERAASGDAAWADRSIARMAVDLEAARALVYAAAALKAEYDRNPASGHLRFEAETLVAEAKYFATNAAHRAASAAVQLRGAGGYALTCRAARHLGDTRALLLDFGANEALEQAIAHYYYRSE
jgi:alkylation response protein AidB-like acyl-CoA dehydrogenase